MAFIRNLTTAFVGNEARKRGRGKGLMGFGLGVVAARIATRSIPGALMVGGAIAAKALYNRSKEKEKEEALAAAASRTIEGRIIDDRTGPPAEFPTAENQKAEYQTGVNQTGESPTLEDQIIGVDGESLASRNPAV